MRKFFSIYRSTDKTLQTNISMSDERAKFCSTLEKRAIFKCGHESYALGTHNTQCTFNRDHDRNALLRNAERNGDAYRFCCSQTYSSAICFWLRYLFDENFYYLFLVVAESNFFVFYWIDCYRWNFSLNAIINKCSFVIACADY